MACRTGDVAAFQANYAERAERFPDAAYAKQWWVMDTKAGMHQARGIYGQLVHVQPERRLVVAKLSSWPSPLDDALDDLTFRAIDAIGQELAG
jgi:CubicO group peptidase (beta-lactamase class C family)